MNETQIGEIQHRLNQSIGQTKLQSIVKAEHKLEAILFCVRVPVGPIPITSIICLVLDFTSRNAECNCLIRFCGDLN